MASRNEIVSFLDERLQVHAIKDVSINGLQVEGRTEVNRVALATDASLAVYEKAVESGTD